MVSTFYCTKYTAQIKIGVTALDEIEVYHISVDFRKQF